MNAQRVKVIATPDQLRRPHGAALFKAGADVFRINMSHATHDGMRERMAMIDQAYMAGQSDGCRDQARRRKFGRRHLCCASVRSDPVSNRALAASVDSLAPGIACCPTTIKVC